MLTNEPMFEPGVAVPLLVIAERNGFPAAPSGTTEEDVLTGESTEVRFTDGEAPGRERKSPKAPAPANAKISKTRTFERRILFHRQIVGCNRILQFPDLSFYRLGVK